MADIQHEDIPLGERHAPHNWEYADAATRTAAVLTNESLVGRQALQLDTGTYWRLASVAPAVWSAVAVKGDAGIDGLNGTNGTNGGAGLSAYEVAVVEGFMGNEAAWLASLQGAAGSSFTVNETGLFSGRSAFNSQAAGFSYLATDNGNLYIRQTATAGTWSGAIPFGKGDKGDDGSDGMDGSDGSIGPSGKSAYQVALDNGFSGDQTAWLTSLKGTKGDNGSNGSNGNSAYTVAVANGFSGSEAAWLLSLKGADGAGGSASDRQNGLLNWIYQSKMSAVVRRGINLFADGFKAADGINTGSSSGYTLDMPGGKISPTAGGQTQIPQATATVLGTMTFNGGNAAGFDGVTNQTYLLSSRTASNAGRGWIGKDWGAGATKTLTGFVAYAPNNLGFDSGGVAASIRLKGSNSAPTAWDGTGFGGTTLFTGTTGSGFAAVFTQMSGITPGSYRYHWIELIGTINEEYCAEVQFFEDVAPSNATIISSAQTISSSTKARLLLEYDNVGVPTLNTDLTAEVSCDGGANYTMTSLTAAGTGQSGRLVAESNEVTCSPGTSLISRVKTLNNKNVPIYGIAATAKA